MTNPLPRDNNSTATSQQSSRLFVLQYPAYRSAEHPYNDTFAQKPTNLRLKPSTGMVEVDVPILTHKYFNKHAGEKFGQALSESRVLQVGGSHGLGGGFTSGPMSASSINLNNIPVHGDETKRVLTTQTLGGKIANPSERDPVYMLGSFRENKLHLTHLDAVVQMRPQLHHIDAEEEINQKKFQSQVSTAGKVKPGFEAGPTKLESRAIELKMKENKDDPKDRNLNTNAKLLRDIQIDQWQSHEWIDEDDQQAWIKASDCTTLSSAGDLVGGTKQLRSIASNDEWLEKMSVPREDGKKGLRAKLKGRDRERARRKRVEYERRKATGEDAPVVRFDGSSDSDLTSLGEQSDAEIVEQSMVTTEASIKQEPGSLPAVSSAPKKRGRPKKAAET